MEERTHEPPSHLNIFVADDDDDMRALVATTFRVDGHTVVEASDGLQLLDILGLGRAGEFRTPDAVFTDLLMPGVSGLGVLEALYSRPVRPPVFLMTVLADRSVLAAARRLGAKGVLFKPFNVASLRRALTRISTNGATAPIVASDDATQLRRTR
jgi:CheY-like chemotaxis protein